MKIHPVAKVKNQLKDPVFVKQPEKIVSEIVFADDYEDGLFKIENQKYIDVVFFFDRSAGYSLVTKIFSGETRGVFASRSPHRPNGLGVSTVKLLKREHNKLVVSGLDALDGTPVVDIKPSDFASLRGLGVMDDLPKNNPRFDIFKYISRGQTDKLLSQAGQLHGHYCPGLSMGVMATAFGMEQLRKDSDGMEDLLAMVETNNCFADGVQYVSGCTFGNNALIFKDFGKNAVSLVFRSGKGVRIRAKNDVLETVGLLFPEFKLLFEEVVKNKNHDSEKVARFREVSREAAFGMLDIPFDELFNYASTQVEIPDYAPIESSLVCDNCHEVFMASRGINDNGRVLCHACNGTHLPLLNGYGIHCP